MDDRNDTVVKQRYGFFIEADNDLVVRTGAAKANIEEISRRSLNESQAAAAYVFHYLIGNTDWSLLTGDGEEFCCHNNDLFEIDDQLYQVPFDFDLAGLVNARYAKPDPSLRIDSVTRRRYRGYCTSLDALRDALTAVKERRSDILTVIRELPGLSTRERDAKIRYLERFFAAANDEDELLESFQRRCL